MPRRPFARLYTPADVALLAEVDRAMATLSGPATACVLRRQRDVFGDERFARLGSISVGHLYNLRNSSGYRNQRVLQTKTQPSKNTLIGVRKAPAPEGRPGFIRIDSVHQGDLDGLKGRYHINAVDCVTQWQVVASVQTPLRGASAQRHRRNAGAVPVRRCDDAAGQAGQPARRGERPATRRHASRCWSCSSLRGH